MPRQARKDLGTPFLHVMVQGVNKEYIFYKEEYIEKYLDKIDKKIEDFDFEILAYCIMNNHAHFLLYAENIDEVGQFMHKSNLLYAQFYNKEKQRTGVLFRNRYQVEPIYNINYLINCIKYIHNNPVKAKIVEKNEEYKYSSYYDYKFNKGVTQTKIMKETFGTKCNYLQLFKESFDVRFIDADASNENRSIYRDYILEGIREFKRKYNKTIVELLSNREEFKKMIFFLNNTCKIKYVEIKDFFEMSRGTMDALKRQ